MTVLIFLLVLSVLVLAHEWGHFITARRAGAKVEEFGFGFPPRLFSWTKNGTVFSLNLIPFGGFVRVFGETGEHNTEPGSFSYLKIGERAKIVAAGVAMNIILAYALLSVINLIGKPDIVDESNQALATNIQIQILDVSPNSPASEAGVKSGDAILSAKINGQAETFADIPDFKNFVDKARGQLVEIKLKRGREILDVSLYTRVNPPEGEGALGVSLARVGFIKSPWYIFWWQGLKDTLTLIGLTASSLFLFFKTLIFTGHLMGEVTGPIGIANLTGQAYQLGWAYLINLTALLSINLAILNILPFPALDGGRLILLGIEKIKGSPVNRKWENAINGIGFALLLALMILVTWQDLAKLFK